MPENAAMVDSIEAQAAADTAAKTESHAAAGSQPKTFTEQELDQRIKERIDKQRARYEEQMAELAKKVEELETAKAEADTKAEQLQRIQDETAWRNAASEATGVPASVIRGASAEECMAHAEAIKAATPSAPVIRDSGSNQAPRPTRESILAIQNERERLDAIRSNAELFQ